MSFAIAIDGPAGAGKSTIAKMVAKERKLLYLDTGAMYRACALKAIRRGISCKDEAGVKEMLAVTDISTAFDRDGNQQIFLDLLNVSHLIRTPEVSTGASDISAIPAVRLQMADIQRSIAKNRDVIMDGRDIGTFVLPDANIKIFLTATAEERAKRRVLQLHAQGIDVSLAQVVEELAIRDERDRNRSVAPMRPAADAVMIDTTGKSIKEVLEPILGLVNDRLIRSH